jgi:hypothetical protein
MAWDEDARGFVLSEPTHRFRALIASPQASGHSQPNNDRRGSEFNRFIFLMLEPIPCAGRWPRQRPGHETAVVYCQNPSTT